MYSAPKPPPNFGPLAQFEPGKILAYALVMGDPSLFSEPGHSAQLSKKS